jgi:hypothetical protein
MKLNLRRNEISEGENEETAMMGMLAMGDLEREDDRFVFSSNFDHIVNTIEDFLTIENNKVVLFDGIEYIFMSDELIRFISILESMMAKMKEKNTCLLIPIDPNVLSDRELRLLERETVNLAKASALS